jgi:hypothetical protein
MLNFYLKKEVHAGRIKGINIHGSLKQQTILQFADDTSMTLAGEEECVHNAINMLRKFSSAFGLQLNWNKSTAYFWEPGGRRRPDWTNTLDL